MMVRGEPDSVDQVPRRETYEAAHPDVEIIYLSPSWQAIIPEDDGETIITRPSLGKLLDKLESLDREPTTALTAGMVATLAKSGGIGRGESRKGWQHERQCPRGS
jgi:hypothetical protein